MNQLIEKLLAECGYLKKEQFVSFYSKDDKAFFFVVSIPELTFSGLKNKEAMRDNQTFKTVLDGFKLIVNNGDQIAIEKNSSLLVLVKCDDINSISRLQQQILLFEEDEFYFKKYVILYTDSSLVGLTSTPILPDLRLKVKNIENFDRFANEGYLSTLAEFLVVIQLFIKLPFLNFEHGIESFIPLSQKIENALGLKHSMYISMLENASGFMQIDFGKPESEERFNELLSNLPND